MPGIGLPVAEKTIADRLRDIGYATGLVGKRNRDGDRQLVETVLTYWT